MITVSLGAFRNTKAVKWRRMGTQPWAFGPFKIDTFDLVLVRLDHVSKGSWQAQLQLVRPRP